MGVPNKPPAPGKNAARFFYADIQELTDNDCNVTLEPGHRFELSEQDRTLLQGLNGAIQKQEEKVDQVLTVRDAGPGLCKLLHLQS